MNPTFTTAEDNDGRSWTETSPYPHWMAISLTVACEKKRFRRLTVDLKCDHPGMFSMEKTTHTEQSESIEGDTQVKFDQKMAEYVDKAYKVLQMSMKFL